MTEILNILRVSIFFLLVALLMTGCELGRQGDGKRDSLLIETAYAQTDSANEDIYQSRQTAITRAVARVSPAVVGINVTQVQRYVRRNPFMNDPFWRQMLPEGYRDRVYERKVESLGSGFIISPDGFIVTNEHVISNASEIVVTMTDGRHLTAKMIGSDPLTDIALLQIEGENFPYLKFGDSHNLLVGEWVIALGNPFGLVQLNDQPTVTVGVISAIDRDWTNIGGRLYQDMIQTDAAINHGNSGGPLVNALGEVVGMNTFIYTGSATEEGSVGIGFALPIHKIKEITAEIRQQGGVNRKYWLGIYDVRALTPKLVSAFDLQVSTGVIVVQLDVRGPAFKAGLREMDVITAIEGKKITSREDYVNLFRNMDLRVGDKLSFDVVRQKEKEKLTVTLDPSPELR